MAFVIPFIAAAAPYIMAAGAAFAAYSAIQQANAASVAAQNQRNAATVAAGIALQNKNNAENVAAAKQNSDLAETRQQIGLRLASAGAGGIDGASGSMLDTTQAIGANGDLKGLMDQWQGLAQGNAYQNQSDQLLTTAGVQQGISDQAEASAPIGAGAAALGALNGSINGQNKVAGASPVIAPTTMPVNSQNPLNFQQG